MSDTHDSTDAEILAYINRTPALMSLLYELDLMPEQHPDHESHEWDQLCTIANHWRENEIAFEIKLAHVSED